LRVNDFPNKALGKEASRRDLVGSKGGRGSDKNSYLRGKKAASEELWHCGAEGGAS